MKYRTCFLTSLSLLKGLNSEYICCIFAELKLTSLINKSIYMSIYFTHNITNSILFKIVNRCSYKLIKILYERARVNQSIFFKPYYLKACAKSCRFCSSVSYYKRYLTHKMRTF